MAFQIKKIDAVGTETKGTSDILATQKKKQEEQAPQENPQVAYASAVLPGLLNGSSKPTQSGTTSGFQA